MICYKCLHCQHIADMKRIMVKGVWFHCCNKCKGRLFMDGQYLRFFPVWGE